MKTVVGENISKQLQTFWQLGKFGIELVNNDSSCNDNRILRELQENIQFRDGRYVVKLPWKDNLKESLENNYEVAYERFSKLCYMFHKDPSLYSEYKNAVDSYITKHYRTRL